MPLTKQMPGHPRDAKFLGGRANDPFEQIVCPKRPRPMGVRKAPAIFFDLGAPPLKSFELHKFGPCEPYRTAASVRLWRIDLAIVHRLPDPKALVLPIYGIPAQS